MRAITVLLADAVGPRHSGTNTGTAITILPETEADDHFLPGVLGSEVVHFCWRGNRDWLDEGMAELIEAHHRSRTAGAEMTASHYPCAHANNILELEQVAPRSGEAAYRCHYALGERLFLDLWRELGEARFQEGAV